MENETLHNFRDISLRFEGEYECEAFNKEGQSKSSKLMINVLREYCSAIIPIKYANYGYTRTY